MANPQQVKELRERTGAGMMDCNRALDEAAGNMDKAIALLRERGLATAAKKTGRVASEGLVEAFLSADRQQGALVEVNSETDFVAINPEFVAFTQEIAALAATANGVAETALAEGQEIMNLKLKNGQTVEAAQTALIARIGENISVRRFARFAVSGQPGILESYIHMAGKIGILIELTCGKAETAKNPALLALARDLAMQVAAAKPEYAKREEVPSEIADREREIYKAQAINDGKPPQVAEKIVVGRIEKYYKEVCLLEQPFIKDDQLSCLQIVKNASAQLGDLITVKRFARFERGEGLAKKSSDFAAEVQAQIQGS